MFDELQLRLMVELLPGRRAGEIAKNADLTVEDAGVLHDEALAFDDFQKFARDVWDRECQAEAVLVVESVDKISNGLCAEATWGHSDVGPVATIRVTSEGWTRRTGLHEIAHLLVDGEYDIKGHRWSWRTEFARLLATYIGDTAADCWLDAWCSALVLADADHEWDPLARWRGRGIGSSTS